MIWSFKRFSFWFMILILNVWAFLLGRMYHEDTICGFLPNDQNDQISKLSFDFWVEFVLVDTNGVGLSTGKNGKICQ